MGHLVEEQERAMDSTAESSKATRELKEIALQWDSNTSATCMGVLLPFQSSWFLNHTTAYSCQHRQLVLLSPAGEDSVQLGCSSLKGAECGL